MGILRHLASGRDVTLSASTRVGRSPDATLRLESRRASGHHAVLQWTDGRWVLRDLGSRNGTWVGGRRCATGERVALAVGVHIGFGAEAATWALAEDGPPVAQARSVDGTRTCDAHGDLLVLPDAEAPVLSVYPAPGGRWVAEGEDGPFDVHDGAIVIVGAVPFRLLLPTVTERTVTYAAATLSVHFRVSPDEEHVELELAEGGRAFALKPRSYFYFLLTLARLRADDTASEAQRGWVHIQDIAQMLRLDRNTINVYVHRVRHQLAKAGVTAIDALVERRPRAGLLRFGVADVRITRL